MTDHDPAECGVMIDAEDTADRDDAIWIQPAGTGFDAWVHIARVADHVQRGRSADVEARRRMYTRYRRDHTRHMLPLPVEQAATLRPGTEPQDTFAVRLRVEADGRVRAVDLGPSRLTRAWAMSHAEAAAAAKHPDHPLHATLNTALRVAQAMLTARRATGALALYDLRSGFATDEEGRLVRLEAAERNSGYVIVQEFMIAANAQIAAWAAERDLPILFRNHRLAAVAGDPSALREELDTVAASGDTAAFEMLRGRMRLLARAATYDPTVGGHAGLQLPVYTHATSPIRRYPDLITQRILLAAALGKSSPYDFEELAELSTDLNTRIAEERERVAEHFKRRAVAETERHLESADYAALPYADFAKVLRLAVEHGDAPEALVGEADRRLRSGELQLREFATVYFRGTGTAFTALRTVLNDRLAAEPNLAVSLLNKFVQDQRGGPVGPEDLRWHVESAGAVHVPAHTAVLEIDVEGRPRRSPPRTQRSKKDARNHAALALAAELAGLPDPSEDVDIDASVPVEAAPELLDADLNPVQAVFIYAARGVVERLRWEFAFEGPPQERVFTCTASAILPAEGTPLEAIGTGPSKQSAKTDAGTRLRAMVEEALAARGADV